MDELIDFTIMVSVVDHPTPLSNAWAKIPQSLQWAYVRRVLRYFVRALFDGSDLPQFARWIVLAIRDGMPLEEVEVNVLTLWIIKTKTDHGLAGCIPLGHLRKCLLTKGLASEESAELTKLAGVYVSRARSDDEFDEADPDDQRILALSGLE